MHLRQIFFQLHTCAVDHFNPSPLYTPRDQTFRDDLDLFSLYHDLLQVWIVKIRLYGCSRRARRLQSFSEAVCTKAENLEAGYVCDRAVLAKNDVDRNRVRFTLPRRL